MSGNRRSKYKDLQQLQKQVQQQPADLTNLPDELATIIKAVPINKRGEIATALVGIYSQVHYSGPIPPPDMLQQYDEIYPGLSKQIVDNAFSETTHRQGLEKDVVPHELSRLKRGQWFGFVIAILGIAAAVYLGAIGQTTVAAVLGGSTVLGLVTVFVIGKKWKQKQQ